jgi:hypothetical protein
MNDRRNWKTIAGRLERRIKDGWNTPKEFHRSTGIQEPTYYSLLRVLDPQADPPPRFETFAVLAHYAGFTPSEIGQAAAEVGAKPWDKIIGGSPVKIGQREQAMLEAVEKIVAKDHALWGRVASSLQFVADMADIDIADELGRMGK